MDTLLGELLLQVLGRVGLFLRYRSKAKIRQVLQEQYQDSYAIAGSIFLINAFGLLFGLSLLALLLAGLAGLCRL